MTGHEFKLSIPLDQGHFERFYRAMARVTKSLGLTLDQRFRFSVCVSEAYTNAYLHGNKKDPRKSIDLHFRWSEDQIEVQVEDQGETRLSETDFGRSLLDVSPEKSAGRGVGIMKQYADKVTIEERAEGGLRVSFTFKLHRRAKQLSVPISKTTGGLHGH